VPELPEVETIVRQLAPRVEGRRLERVEVFDARWCRPLAPAELSGALAGRTVERLWRRGKYLVWGLGELFLLMHLRMTGTLLYDPIATAGHVRARLELDDGHRLLVCDPRRFGTAELARGRRAADDFFAARLGVEPLGPGFTEPYLRALARGRRAPVKAFLLDQRRIAGVGNIYADEALFRARVHPLRPAGRLTVAQLGELHRAVVSSLRAGIGAGGATIDDYRDADGLRGSFQDQFLVHRRAGEPCPRCGATIVKLVAAGRGSYVCESCQPRPRRRRPAVAQRSASSSLSRPS
jgi:formamidopyrimidine-DNA glycosylase